MSLLRDFIKALVTEAIARPGHPDSRQRPEQFKLNEFKALRTLEAMLSYAYDRLDMLGTGTARKVFRMTGTKVLKVGSSMTKGVAQNKAEVDVFTNPKTAPVVTKIFDYDPNFLWLVSEVVRPLGNDEEFQQETGIPFEQFAEILYGGVVPEDWADIDPEMMQFLAAALSLSKTSGLEVGDIAVRGHWGKSADGRIVLLDYGYTTHVRQQTNHEKPFSNDAQEPVKREDPKDVDWSDLNFDEEPAQTSAPASIKRALPPTMHSLAQKLRMR